jgi:hypothetical protein
MPPSNEYLIMKMNACCQATPVGLNMLDRAALRRSFVMLDVGAAS